MWWPRTPRTREKELTRAAERLSAQGRSKRLLVEPGVTAARSFYFSGLVGAPSLKASHVGPDPAICQQLLELADAL
jgi:hypothetical protein